MMVRLDRIVNGKLWRGAVSILAFLLLWELGSRSGEWFGIAIPVVGQVPAPSAVAATFAVLIRDPGYWQSWYLSTFRVCEGCLAAMAIGIPFGLALAVSRTFF